MSVSSDFRRRIKVKVKTKEKRYRSSEITLREDSQTGKIEIYITKEKNQENPEEQTREAWTIHRIEMTDINIENPHNVILYDLVISPSGHFAHKEYWNPSNKERYGKTYSLEDILYQLDGENDDNRTYTKQELIELAKKLNRERKNTKFSNLFKVEYEDNFRGERFLEGKHITSTSEQIMDDLEVWKWVCVEDENILVEFDKKNNLITKLNGKKEKVKQTKYHTKLVDKLPYPTSMHDASFKGFTIKALTKIIENQEKERIGGKDHE